MTALLAGVCAVFGLLIGSFLNVVVWRIPRGESIVRPPSRCPECEAPIRPRDNVPVLSWLLLRGKCRGCGTPISKRYPVVEVATAAVFVVLALRFGWSAVLPAFLYLGAVGVALTLIDLDVRRLPNAIVLPSYVVSLVLLAGAALATGDLWSLVRSVLGMAVLYIFYLVLVLVYPAGMGFGDVKLAGLLGLYLGWLGWGEVAVGAFLGFLFGGLVGGVLMLLGRAGRKSKIPFGPYMLAGAFVSILWGEDVAQLYLDTLII